MLLIGTMVYSSWAYAMNKQCESPKCADSIPIAPALGVDESTNRHDLNELLGTGSLCHGCQRSSFYEEKLTVKCQHASCGCSRRYHAFCVPIYCEACTRPLNCPDGDLSDNGECHSSLTNENEDYFLADLSFGSSSKDIEERGKLDEANEVFEDLPFDFEDDE